MQAIRVHDYGASDVLTLETLAPPEPQPNEVLIRVQAAGVNPLDCKIRAGYMKEIFPIFNSPTQQPGFRDDDLYWKGVADFQFDFFDVVAVEVGQ